MLWQHMMAIAVEQPTITTNTDMNIHINTHNLTKPMKQTYEF